MDYTSVDVIELASLLAAPGLDDLTTVRLARNDVSTGLIETAVLRFNIIMNWCLRI
ncbi:hypothetical protein [Duganella phyllosphaerae]|uniref:hypothetical protein n=1 Tax=Duganella phyllosphaerae TaxID=762836 RepID=UPI001428A8BD|nr:hypothetical protein [Duganella phyllosphaerae]